MRYRFIGLFSLLTAMPLFAGAPENVRAAPGAFVSHTVQEDNLLIVWTGERVVMLKDGAPIFPSMFTDEFGREAFTIAGGDHVMFSGWNGANAISFVHERDGTKVEMEWGGGPVSAQTCRCSQLTSTCEPSGCAAIDTCGTAQPQSHYCQWYYLTEHDLATFFSDLLLVWPNDN